MKAQTLHTKVLLMKPFEAEMSYPLSRLRERVGVRAGAKDKACELRERMTEAEGVLWQHLRGRRFQDFKFRRQRPLGPHILDFVCLQAGLVIEIDDGQHVQQQTYDQARTALIESQGLTVIRFWNSDLAGNPDGVAETILGKVIDL